MVLISDSVKEEPKDGRREFHGPPGDVTDEDDKAKDTATRASAGVRTRLLLAKDWAS